MLEFIKKKDFFRWLESGVADPTNQTLKGIQDAWVLSQLQDLSRKKIVEVGGGNSRILERLVAKNKCWNIDRFEGTGAGPKSYSGNQNINIVKSFMGEFSNDLKDNFFDVGFSVSVIEHVPVEDLNRFFKDVARILKPGSIFYSAIDVYLGDTAIAMSKERLEAYLTVSVDDTGFDWVQEPGVSADATFQCDIATNSDVTMNDWNRIAPALRNLREVTQSTSLCGMWKRI